ncbi:unnamed protein product [Urochloa decumbens]|uniref:Uncharacterized protein n=1 Tax=Urochloa decumbens TaxID=240449 RepID=A0ABC9DZ82_9POAL
MEPDEDEPSLCYRLVKALLTPILFWVLIFYLGNAILMIITACEAINISHDNPMESTVQLLGFKGLEPTPAPGAVSPAFDLLVRVDNGHIYDEYFCVGSKARLSFTVNATGEAVGLPDDVFRLVSAERSWAVAQLDVRMQLGCLPDWESFAWSVDLDG